MSFQYVASAVSGQQDGMSRQKPPNYAGLNEERRIDVLGAAAAVCWPQTVGAPKKVTPLFAPSNSRYFYSSLILYCAAFLLFPSLSRWA